MVFLIGFGTFFGSIGTSSSANDTNNTTNITQQTIASQVTPQSRGWFPSVSLDVTPAVDSGNRVSDGLEIAYPSVTQINASGSEWFPGSDTLNLYVRASGNFVSGSNTILLNNFKYDGFSNSALSKTSFTTTNSQIQSWSMASWSVDETVYGNYYFTVPMGSTDGTYTTTVYYTVML